MTTKPHTDPDVAPWGFARVLHGISRRMLDRPAWVTLRLTLFYTVLLFAVPWLILNGPAVMPPSIRAFAQAAEDGRATLHNAAAKAQPAIRLWSKDNVTSK